MNQNSLSKASERQLGRLIDRQEKAREQKIDAQSEQKSKLFGKCFSKWL
jgi:hypothetical protein